jgi:hypothetical protein
LFLEATQPVQASLGAVAGDLDVSRPLDVMEAFERCERFVVRDCQVVDQKVEACQFGSAADAIGGAA